VRALRSSNFPTLAVQAFKLKTVGDRSADQIDLYLDNIRNSEKIANYREGRHSTAANLEVSNSEIKAFSSVRFILRSFSPPIKP